jgi:hypothetical protein
MEGSGMCWSIKAITRLMCPMTTSNYSNLYRHDSLNWKIYTCPPGNLPSAGYAYLAMAMVQKPSNVEGFIVLRTEKDKRSAFIKWKPVDNAFAYNIYYGIHPDKLYTSIMIHSNNEYWMKAMDSQKTYYYSIEAINENGVSERSKVIEVK